MYESRKGISDLRLSDFRIQNSEFRIQNSGFRLQTSSELRLETWDLRLLWTSDFGLQTLGTSLPIFHSLLLCTNMDDVSRLPYRGALRGKKDCVGASFGSQFTLYDPWMSAWEEERSSPFRCLVIGMYARWTFHRDRMLETTVGR